MIQISLIDELKRIRDIPSKENNTCHIDHRKMSNELNILIERLKKNEKQYQIKS